MLAIARFEEQNLEVEVQIVEGIILYIYIKHLILSLPLKASLAVCPPQVPTSPQSLVRHHAY